MDPKIYVLHENPEWVKPLWDELNKRGAPYCDWMLERGRVDFDSEPPPGVFYNRISASSHTRGHRYSPEIALVYLHWLAKHGRRVLNSHNALHLEISKMAEYRALQAAGARTPATAAATGTAEDVIAAAATLDAPFILKPNRGGKGAGVNKFDTLAAARDYLRNLAPDETPIDGIWLAQQYIASPEPHIVRCEFVGRKFLYAVKVDSGAGFELCPADQCEIDTAPDGAPAATPNKFSVIPDFEQPELLERYARVMQNNGVHVAGFEFARDADGEIYTYDLNTNTNYNSQAERAAGVKDGGMASLANYLCAELELLSNKSRSGSFRSD